MLNVTYLACTFNKQVKYYVDSINASVVVYFHVATDKPNY